MEESQLLSWFFTKEICPDCHISLVFRLMVRAIMRSYRWKLWDKAWPQMGFLTSKWGQEGWRKEIMKGGKDLFPGTQKTKQILLIKTGNCRKIYAFLSTSRIIFFFYIQKKKQALLTKICSYMKKFTFLSTLRFFFSFTYRRRNKPYLLRYVAIWKYLRFYQHWGYIFFFYIQKKKQALRINICSHMKIFTFL